MARGKLAVWEGDGTGELGGGKELHISSMGPTRGPSLLIREAPATSSQLIFP